MFGSCHHLLRQMSKGSNSYVTINPIFPHDHYLILSGRKLRLLLYDLLEFLLFLLVIKGSLLVEEVVHA